MTRLQEETIARLCLKNGGRVAVRDGYADQSVEVTLLNLANFRVTPDGYPHPAGVNASIDWSYE